MFVEPPLLMRPAPGREEGAKGYLLRLAEANCMSTSELLHLGVNFDVQSLEHHRLLPDPALDPDLYRHIARVGGSLDLTGRIWNQRYARCCPQCLAEEPTWKATWELFFHDACPKHGVWLVDQCASCGESLNWKRNSLLRCDCGADLRFEATQAAPESVRRLAARLEAKLFDRDGEQDPPLGGLSLEQTQRLIRYLGCHLDLKAGPRPLKLRNAGQMDASWPVTSLAAELLRDWPNRFLIVLSHFYEQSSEQSRLGGVFHQTYHYLYKGLPEAAYSPIREVFEGWLATHWKGGLALRNRRLPVELLKNVSWIHAGIAAKKLGISTNRLRSLVQEGKLEGQESVSNKGVRILLVRQDQLSGLRDQLGAEMTLAEAIESLGIGKVRLRRVLRFLFPEARKIGDKLHLPWCVPRAEVERLLEIGSGLPVVSIPEEHEVSLAHVLKYWNWQADEIVALVEGARDGKIPLKGLLAGRRGISAWIFETQPLRAFQLRLQHGQSNWLSIPQVADALGIKQQVAYWLTGYGYLHAEKIGTRKGLGSRISRAELARFRENYVFGRDLAVKLGCSPQKAAKMLMREGVQPLRGHAGEPCRLLVYAQTKELDLAMGLLTGCSVAGFSLHNPRNLDPPVVRKIEPDGKFIVKIPKAD